MRTRALAALLLGASLALPAAAQTFRPDARPAAGTLRPRADRAPEMLDLTLRGATVPTEEGCVGFAEPSAPDAVVEWRGGPLRLAVRSAADATLIVVDPAGAWHCNDDAEGLMPAVELASAPRGRYAVWVGSLSEGGGAAATLVAGPPATAARLGAASDAPTELRLAAGFGADGADEVAVRVTALDAVASLGLPPETYCTGFVDAARPSLRVRYAGAGERLSVRAVSSDADPVLVVRTPSGALLCDDDSGEGSGAALAAPAEAGDYAVWAGTFFSAARTDAQTVRLSLDEDEVVDPDAMDVGDGELFEEDYQQVPFSTGLYEPLDPDRAPATRLALGAAAEEASAAVTVRPSIFNPVQGDACRGQVEPAPTAAVTLAGSGPVGITASGDGDLVLVVQTPAGAWWCSDDANELAPGIQLDAPEPGTYLVWVGGFTSSGEGMEELADGEAGAFGEPDVFAATLTLSRGPITVSEPDFGDSRGAIGMGEPFADGQYDGSALTPGQSRTTLRPGDGADVQAGGSLLNPVAGPTCAGFLTAAPTALVELDGGGATVRAAPTEPDDLVLLVHTPDGRWICADDADGGPDPMVRLGEGVPGLYSVWVGAYSRRDAGVPARLTVEP